MLLGELRDSLALFSASWTVALRTFVVPFFSGILEKLLRETGNHASDCISVKDGTGPNHAKEGDLWPISNRCWTC